MNIWKWLGWDTKEARTERNIDNNKHSTIQWVAGCIAAIIIVALIWS